MMHPNQLAPPRRAAVAREGGRKAWDADTQPPAGVLQPLLDVGHVVLAVVVAIGTWWVGRQGPQGKKRYVWE